MLSRARLTVDLVWLLEPAAAAAVTDTVADPRAWELHESIEPPKLCRPERAPVNRAMVELPLPPETTTRIELIIELPA
ncbi:hypothetical protein ACWD7C_31520 [Streptomyces sp. NPDC005134]|uniref:hypothetical protein n=1 Tax=unclassified Streptomyces TaxID=2593676 RepID=UPI0033B58249